MAAKMVVQMACWREYCVWSLVALHVRGKRCSCIIAAIAGCALERFSVVVSFEVNFEVVTSREGASAMLALVPFVAGMQFDVPISASLVLEGPITEAACVNDVL